MPKRKREPDAWDYGLYPGEARYHVDQVPADFASYGRRSVNDKGTGVCHITGAKGMDKRQHTMQLCFRAEAPQIVKPAVIFHGKPFIDAAGNIQPRIPLRKRLAERKQYHPDVDVYWDVKAYAGSAVCDAWLEDFDKQTKRANKKRILGLDHWSPQDNDDYHENASGRGIKLNYTPEDTTHLTAVTDDGPGNEIKKRVVKMYKADLEKSPERLDQWKNGKVSASERRILFTHWLAKAWKDYTTNCQAQITKAFKRCGQYNDMEGRENHLVKVQGVPGYEVPAKDSARVVDPLKAQKKKKQKSSA